MFRFNKISAGRKRLSEKSHRVDELQCPGGWKTPAPDFDGRELPAVWRELCNCGAFYGGAGNDPQLFPGT